MEHNMFVFLFNGEKNLVPQNFFLCREVNPAIIKKLKKDNKYEIKSNVKEENLISFLNYLKGTQVPEVNEQNKLDFIQLSKEFNVMRSLFVSIEDDTNECLNDIEFLQDPNNKDRYLIEEKISQNLDNVLNLCGEKFLESPINSVYNIFSKSKSQFNHDRAYYLINQHYKNHKDKNIFILISTFDYSKLNQENLKDAIDSKNFMPSNEYSFIKNLIEQHQKLKTEKENFHLETQIQKEKIESLKKILFEFIQKNYDEYSSNWTQLKIKFIIPIVDIKKWNSLSITECSLALNDQKITISASSSYNREDHSVVYLFNGTKEQDGGNRWASNYLNSADITIIFQKPVIANIIYMTPRYPKCVHQGPSNFNIYAGNDSQNLTLIKEFKKIKWNDNDNRYFLFNNSIEYLYYKIEFIHDNGSQHFGLSELNLCELVL